MRRILAFLLTIAISFSVLLLPCAAAASYPFYDVRKTAWYANAVRYVYQNQLFAGTDATTFSPEAYLTRAMLVSVLWRREGSPEVSEEKPVLGCAGRHMVYKRGRLGGIAGNCQRHRGRHV